MQNDALQPRRTFLATSAAMCSLASVAAQTQQTEAPAEAAREKILDSHLHINHFERTIEDTIKHMDATGTDKAFILPLETGEGRVTLRTETVLHTYYQHPDRVIPFCQTDIRRLDVLDRIRAYHLLGCRGNGLTIPSLGIVCLCERPLGSPFTI